MKCLKSAVPCRFLTAISLRSALLVEMSKTDRRKTTHLGHRRRAAALPKPEWQDCTILIQKLPVLTRPIADVESLQGYN
jgi:hypothetical protein